MDMKDHELHVGVRNETGKISTKLHVLARMI